MPYKAKGKCVYKGNKKVGCTKGSVKKYLTALRMHHESDSNNNGVYMDYEKFFKKALLSEEETVNMTPSETEDIASSDEQAWQQSNPEIVDNEDLASKFEVEGLNQAEIEKYSEVIGTWGKSIQNVIDQLAQIIKFSAGERLAEAPGSEQFNALIKKAPGLKSDLSAFKSQVEDLQQTVKLAISDANKERKDKINSLK